MLAITLAGLSLALAPAALANSAIGVYGEFRPTPGEKPSPNDLTSSPGNVGAGNSAANSDPTGTTEPAGSMNGAGSGTGGDSGNDDEHFGAGGADIGPGSGDDLTPTSVLKSAVGGSDVGLELRDLLVPILAVTLSLGLAVAVSNRIRARRAGGGR